MKTSLTHLPEIQQKEIAEILQIIKEEANPEKVILFGSYARSNWIADEYQKDGVQFSYISDYDFLVVIKKDGVKEQTIISQIESRCSKDFKNVICPIVHDIEYINEGMRNGQYFFIDILTEGILLFDTESFEFENFVHLNGQEKKEKAQHYFDKWHPQAREFLDVASFCLSNQYLKIGVFNLHQATECFYIAALMVYVGYKPRTHNLLKLRNYAKHISIKLYSLFKTPISDKCEFNPFDVLRRGYGDSRYKMDYVIAEEELKELINKVAKMQEIVRSLCEEKIDALGANIPIQ